ncbi:MAG: Hsp20/alpha crystallin family protein [Rhodospirillales bacterium]|jgi:HSP20 family molecular chaperone IbpA|nr:Hsp20/alpha crystallin family protein [Rhodospirillales bacterium]
MLDRAERLQREFFQLSVERERGPAWQPPIDVIETEHEVAVVVALPGVRPHDVAVAVEDGTLVISAVRSLPRAGSGSVIRRLEIPYGRFERRVVLDGETLRLDRRDFANGCLMLTFRKIG